jgi:hypothetical protein
LICAIACHPKRAAVRKLGARSRGRSMQPVILLKMSWLLAGQLIPLV